MAIPKTVEESVLHPESLDWIVAIILHSSVNMIFVDAYVDYTLKWVHVANLGSVGRLGYI